MQEDDLSEEGERDRASRSAEGEMSDFGEESEGDMVSVSTDEEMSLSEPGLDFDDYESDWFILRTKFWKILGYQKHLLIRDSIQNMWRANLEIETIGWSVVPLMAFSDPDRFFSYLYSDPAARLLFFTQILARADIVI